MAVASDSAGGYFTLMTLLRAGDAELPLPAAGVLLAPGTDLAGTDSSLAELGPANPVLADLGISWWLEAYLAGADPRSPAVSPVYADLRGLPALLIHVSTSEMLLGGSTPRSTSFSSSTCRKRRRPCRRSAGFSRTGLCYPRDRGGLEAMKAATTAKQLEDLDGLIAEVVIDAEPILLSSGRGQHAVLLSLDEFNSWQETLYLLSNPANAAHLRKSMAEAEAGKIVERELIDP